jgi:hypothetical protein
VGTAAVSGTAETVAVAVTVPPHFLPVERKPGATGNTILNIVAVLHIGTALLQIDSEERRAVTRLQSAKQVLVNSLVGRVALYPAFAPAARTELA